MTEKRLTEEERRRKFFYAENESGVYDASIELVVPYYKLMHEMMLELLEVYFRKTESVNTKDIKDFVLDIGFGTGMEAMGVINRFENIHLVGIDLCKPMLERFHKKTKGAPFSDRITLKHGDFLDEECEPDELKELLPCKMERKLGFKAVISAFTLHHLTREEKEEAYRRICELLEPGGIMINGDLFNYTSSDLAAYASDFDLAYISTNFDNPNNFDSASIGEEKRIELKSRWLKHYKEDNILDSVGIQEEMLRKIGFSQTCCPFRFWQVGILWARK